jgi:hypothetical protein
MKWIKVESGDELAAGMTVEIRPCGFCGRTERLILMRQVSTELPAALNGDGDFVQSSCAWKTAPALCQHPRRPFDPTAAIATGRLFRLADPGVTDTADVKQRPRELANVDGGSER